MRVLIIKTSSIGDVLHTFPAVNLIRTAAGAESVSWVVNDSLADVVKLCPGVDEIIPFPRKKAWNPLIFLKFIRQLRLSKYDVAVDYQGLFRSGLITWFSRSKIRAGFSNAREGAPFFYSLKASPGELNSHAVDKNIELTRRVFELGTAVPPRIPLNISAADNAAAQELLPLSGGEIPVAVCFSSRWNSKNWPLPFIAEVLKNLQTRLPGAKCWLLGGSSDYSAGEELRQLAGSDTVINLSGKTRIPVLAALLQRSKALFTVDSGPMHLAAALGIPCVAMFGATSAELTGPYGAEGFHTVIKSRCPESPCFRRECTSSQCCSQGINPADAAEIIISKTVEKLP